MIDDQRHVDGTTVIDPDPSAALHQWTEAQIDQSAMDQAAEWLEAELRAGGSEVSSTLPRFDDGGTVEFAGAVSNPQALMSRVAPTAVALLLFNVASGFPEFLVARVYGVAFLLLVPGAVILAASRTRPAHGAVRLALAAATSLLYLMLAALAADRMLPVLGISEPLDRWPMLVVVDVTMLLALLVVARRTEPLVALFGARLPNPWQVGLALTLAALPVASAAGAQAVRHGRGSTLAIETLVAGGVLLVALAVGANRVPGWFVPAGLYAVALAMIYSYAFSGDRLYGWDIQQEFQAFSTTMRANAWYPVVDQDPYRAMLSITALPAVLSRLTGMSGESLFRGVYPLLFASFPVLVYVVAGRWVSKSAAAFAAAFIVVQLAFSQQLPAITRQEIALVFFGVLVAIVFDDELPVPYRRVVAVAAGSALAFTHYSTAYVTALAMFGAWALGGVVRVALRGRHQPRVLVLPVVLSILGFTMLWNFAVTQSGENVERFAEQVAERGPEFLPSSAGQSLIDRWLTGNAPQRISGEDYARRVDIIYAETAPWLNGYADAVVEEHPVTNASTPQTAGVVPAAGGAFAKLLVIASQAVVALTTVGAVLFAWRRRRDWSSAHELATLGVVLLGFVAAMRVSGVAAEAYNQERAQIHTAAVLSVGFAAVMASSLARWRRPTLAALGGALAVIFVASSGLAPFVVGGAAPANLAATGDARERFSVTDPEVATAEWLAVHRFPDSIVYGDRYGKLRIWAAAVPIEGPSLQSVLTPATLDRNAYVYATEANVLGERARGAIGAEYAVYEFPRSFLDATKATIYSTATTAVYR